MFRVVTGIPSERLDYSVCGSELSILTAILDGTEPGEFGIDINIWQYLFPYGKIPSAILLGVTFESNYLKFAKHCCSIIWDYFLKEIKVNLSAYMNKNSSHNVMGYKSPEEARIAKFVNQAVWKRLMGLRDKKIPQHSATVDGLSDSLLISTKLAPDGDRDASLEGDCHELQESDNSNELGVAKPIPPASSTAQISKHHLQQRTERLQQNDSDHYNSMINKKFSGEFRNVTIIFVKLKFEFETHRSQLAIAGFLKCLKKYEGVFQQFSGMYYQKLHNYQHKNT
ncbi:hypothetical protein HDU76_012065 [Blyttiomyces sp. JEL0837]|nr:hypothetical protein HDU76_012065 [Blyttiomyces sp. JEL0837]